MLYKLERGCLNHVRKRSLELNYLISKMLKVEILYLGLVYLYLLCLHRDITTLTSLIHSLFFLLCRTQHSWRGTL